MADGRAGDDRLTGSSQGDLLLGGNGDDVLAGGEGRDALDGGLGEDDLSGGGGADKLVGAAGDDRIAGGSGGDVYLFSLSDGAQVDTVSEGAEPGVDVLSLDYGRARVRVDLGAPGATVAVAPEARILAGAGASRRFEGVIGGGGNDLLLGSDADNHFWGGGGTDRAVGRRGNDVYHADWSGSLPSAAYGFGESWIGPIPRGEPYGRSTYESTSRPPSRLQIEETRHGGLDTLDLAEVFSSAGLGSRLEGQIRAGARIDLSGAGTLASAGRVSAVAGTSGTAANIENVRGTIYDDTVVGNAAANVLEGRDGRDRISGGPGSDTCLVHRSEDVLRSCEHIRARNPDR